LFSLSLDGRLTAVPISLRSNDGPPDAGAPVPLFAPPVSSLRDTALHHYIVDPDGQRFLVDTPVEETASPIVLLLNWMAPKRPLE
jgi:hypothetical protein